MAGIYITRGTAVSIPQFSIYIGEDGRLEKSSEPVSLHLRFDVSPTWIQIARRHLETALAARERRRAAWQNTDETAKSQTLEDEFEASMQAMMAAAIAWDGVYAVLREYVVVPEELVETWRRGRTARYSQVAEIVRRAFSLKNKGAARLRASLKELYRCRDMAVHPSGKIEAAVLHPELKVGTEWRFVLFRAENAELVVMSAAAMLWEIANSAKSNDPKVIDYQRALASRLSEIFPAGPPVVPPPAGAS